MSEYSNITLTFVSGGSGGGAYYSAILEGFQKHPKIFKKIIHTTGVSAGGVAAYCLATHQIDKNLEVWKDITFSNVVKSKGMQNCVESALKKNLNLDLYKDVEKNILSKNNFKKIMNFDIFAFYFPSQTSNKITFKDRILSRFAYHLAYHFFHGTSIKRKIISASNKHLKYPHLLSKIMMGGARFFPPLMGPTLKIFENELHHFSRKTSGILADYSNTSFTPLELLPKNQKEELFNSDSLHFIFTSFKDEKDVLGFRKGRMKSIKKLKKEYPKAQIVVIHPNKALGTCYGILPYYMCISNKRLYDYYEIGKETMNDFFKNFS